MNKVLVVDVDEAQGAALAKQGKSAWHVRSVTTSASALALIASEHWDVVLINPMVDVRVNLVERTKEIAPSTVRIVLADNLDEVQALRVMSAAHQFVPRPVEISHVAELLQVVGGLQSVLGNRDLAARLGALDAIPSPAPHVWRLRWLLSDPNVAVESVVELIDADPGLSARLLSLANSPYFGSRNSIRSTEHALAFLGLDMVRDVVLMIDVFKAFEGFGVADGFSFAGVHRHILLVMRLVRKMTEGKPCARTAGVAALLHDVGRLVLGVHLKDYYRAIHDHRVAKGVSELQAERAVMGFSHAEIGAYVLSAWGMPSTVVEAVAFHHEPRRSHPEGFDAVMAVHIADCLIHEVHGEVDQAWTLDYALVEELGLEPRMDRWRALAREIVASG